MWGARPRLGRTGRRVWEWVDPACPAVGQGRGRSVGGVKDDPQVLMQVGVSGRLREQVGEGVASGHPVGHVQAECP